MEDAIKELATWGQKVTQEYGWSREEVLTLFTMLIRKQRVPKDQIRKNGNPFLPVQIVDAIERSIARIHCEAFDTQVDRLQRALQP
jgi:hypothetical protein